MADFVGLLKKTIDAQANPTPQLRQRVYERARETVGRKLVTAKIPEHAANLQLQALSAAIEKVESEYQAAERSLHSAGIEKKRDVEFSENQSSQETISNKPLSDETKSFDTQKLDSTHSQTQPTSNFTSSSSIVSNDLSQNKRQDESVDSVTSKSNDEVKQPASHNYQHAYSFANFSQNTVNANDIIEKKPVDALTKHEPIFKETQEAGKENTTHDISHASPLNINSDSGAILNDKTEVKDHILIDKTSQFKADKNTISETEIINSGVNKDLKTGINNNEKNVADQKAQTGDFDIVSDIFSQAARRNERKAAKKRHMIIGGSVAVLLLIVFGVLYIGWGFLSDKKPSHPTTASRVEEPLSGAQSNQKLTQRLLPDGSEVDPGPAQDTPTPGEGTSNTAARTTQQTSQMGEAVFYQARTDNVAEKIETGHVEWSIVREAAQNNGPEEPAIRGNLTIPDENLTLRMTLRRNTDSSIPAAYLLELIFIVPNNFAGGAIDNIHEFTFKASEQSIGQPLRGAIVSKIDDDFFLLALSGARPFVDGNLQLMRQLGWMRLVITDKNGRISELTFSKGSKGEEVFGQVIDQWLQNENNNAQ
ncbi:hypothetical protein [Bartonella tamiae]|uniref:hypothetical protein n=1 Tax=Bartonella tamiae TaxID=373638 RepID=UPI00026E7A7F|nr:hypothetical protein [Bartonella tamiae]EJF92708.1 hypothetical protein MEG_01878 [Bartonella tamiae Th307]